ncbi:MAG: hypothetical protein NZU63_11670 [Gemmataceae bacterium]|nr:hypothetical protein [Gemmataceae bacterium]MDW8243871.1 hypothetical protein [Thermogemmata sp.]
MSRRPHWPGVVLGFAGGLLLIVSSKPGLLHGQPKLPEIKPLPQGPILTSPAHLGLRAGEKAELVLTGANLAEPVGIWSNCPGITIAVPTDNKNGSDPGRLRVQVSVPADTPIGVYGLRLATRHGVSNVRPLVVDELPVVSANEANRNKSSAQAVAVPVVVLGRIEAESSNFFKITVAAGQRLTLEVLARRVGSPLDPLIVLHDAKTQRELIHLTADDTPGLQGDCRLTHTFSQAGDYLIEVRDSTWRGGADFHYRLRIADCPGVTTAFPLAVQRGAKASIGFAGPGTEALPALAVPVPTDPTVETLWVAPRYGQGGCRGWPVPVRVHDWPETVEQEPNQTPLQAQSLPVPGGVSARFDKVGDLDHFRVTARKGQKLAALARTFEFQSPCEVFIRILNAKGNELARSNPSQPTARAEWTAPEDGDYIIVCEHLNYRGGANEVYHLCVQPVVGDFTLSCVLDRAEAPAGGRLTMLVTVNRLDGFNGPVELQAVGTDLLQGTSTIAAGQNFALLPLEVRPGTPPGVYPFRVQGRATIGGQTVTRYASCLDTLKAGWANMSHPPLDLAGLCAAGVIQPAFHLTVRADPPTLAKGHNGKLHFLATRDKGVEADIAVAAVYLPPNLTVAPPAIPKGQTQATAEIKVAPAAPPGTHPLLFRANSKIAGKDYAVYAPTVLHVTEPPKEAKKESAPADAKKQEPQKK